MILRITLERKKRDRQIGSTAGLPVLSYNNTPVHASVPAMAGSDQKTATKVGEKYTYDTTRQLDMSY